MLNKQSFETNTKPVDIESERTSTLDEICQFLKDTFTFQLDVDHEVTEDKLMSGLRDCIRYCFRNKMFIRIKTSDEDGNDEYRYKLNSIYIRHKMKASKMDRSSSSTSNLNLSNLKSEKEVYTCTVKVEPLADNKFESSKILIFYNC